MEKAKIISTLTSIIAENAAKIESYLVSNNLPTPSFDADIPPNLLFDPQIIEARGAILEATNELHSLMLGPMLTLMNWETFRSVRPIQHYKLASTFQNEATFEEIASSSGLAEDQVKRIIRHATTFHIFQEPRKGVVAHTAASKLLANNPLMSQWVGMVTEEMWPASTRVTDAIAKWGDSGEPNHCAFNIAHNTDKPAFEEFSELPERESRFAGAMTWFHNRPGFEIAHIVDGYNWAEFGAGVVVDVGGSHGNVCIGLAEKFPSLQLIVQDLPDVIKTGRSKLPSHLQDQVTFMEHDFFAEQPVKGAGVYLLRWILHDWADSFAIRILKALVPALKHRSRILINEHVLPEPGAVSVYKDRQSRTFDFSMWELNNGKERDVDDWVKLLRDTDKRFHLSKVNQPAGSFLALVEVEWVEV